MTDRPRTPSITVTIGHHTRLYFAFVTTAPAALDSPGTITLYASSFAKVMGFAADPVSRDVFDQHPSARLVLVDAMEHAWQRAKYIGAEHVLLAADPALVEERTLQRCLWQRLQSATSQQVAA